MKRLVAALSLLGAALLLGACSAAAAPSTPAPSLAADAIQISSKDLKFSTDRLVAPANKPFQIVYDNQEAAPHNVAIYKDDTFSEKVFAESPFGGPKSVVYSVPAQPAGTYAFRCDVHPDMKGTLEVK
jgi:plastocyanin